MSNEHAEDAERSNTINRRSTLAAIGAGAASAVFGIGALTGTASAWDRFDVEFRECSKVRIVVGDDLHYDPPAVAHVIVESGGEAACRSVEFTEENATTSPDQYGGDPAITYDGGDDERILGVLSYNIAPEGEGRFSRPRCILLNDNECARGWETPDVRHSECVRNAIRKWGEFTECWWEPAEWSGPSNEDGADEENGSSLGDSSGDTDPILGDDSEENESVPDGNSGDNSPIAGSEETTPDESTPDVTSDRNDSEERNPSGGDPDDDAVSRSMEDSPGLGVGSAIASLGGAGYLLFRRFAGDEER